MDIYFKKYQIVYALLKMSGRDRVDTGKKPDANPFGFYPVLYGFYLDSNFIFRDLSGSIRSLNGKW